MDAEEGKRAVHLAFEKGINFFDTSPFYGDTKSESALGAAIKDLPRDEIVVATKVGRYGAETFDFSAERVMASVDESLERLGISYIDLIQCHDMEFVHLDQILNETLPALSELKRLGKVKHIGITGLPLKIFEYILDRVPVGTVDCVLSYCHYTVCDSTLDNIVPYLKSKHVGIINASPLCMGLLTKRGPPVWHPAPAELIHAAKAAADACTDLGVDIADVALQYSLKNESIATTLVGMCTTEQVEENCAAVIKAFDQQSQRHTHDSAFDHASQAVHDLISPVHNMTWPSGLAQNN